MQELIAPLVGLLFGLLLWRSPRRARPTFNLFVGVIIATAAGLFATLITGEYLSGWADLALDTGLAAMGVYVSRLARLVIRAKR